MKKYIVVFETGFVTEIEVEKLTEEIIGNLIWNSGNIYKINEVGNK